MQSIYTGIVMAKKELRYPLSDLKPLTMYGYQILF